MERASISSCRSRSELRQMSALLSRLQHFALHDIRGRARPELGRCVLPDYDWRIAISEKWPQRAEHFYFFVTNVIGFERDRRLHGGKRESWSR